MSLHGPVHSINVRAELLSNGFLMTVLMSQFSPKDARGAYNLIFFYIMSIIFRSIVIIFGSFCALFFLPKKHHFWVTCYNIWVIIGFRKAWNYWLKIWQMTSKLWQVTSKLWQDTRILWQVKEETYCIMLYILMKKYVFLCFNTFFYLNGGLHIFKRTVNHRARFYTVRVNITKCIVCRLSIKFIVILNRSRQINNSIYSKWQIKFNDW